MAAQATGPLLKRNPRFDWRAKLAGELESAEGIATEGLTGVLVGVIGTPQDATLLEVEFRDGRVVDVRRHQSDVLRVAVANAQRLLFRGAQGSKETQR